MKLHKQKRRLMVSAIFAGALAFGGAAVIAGPDITDIVCFKNSRSE